MPRSQRHQKIWLVVDAEIRRPCGAVQNLGARLDTYARVRIGTGIRDKDVPAKRAASGTKHEHFPPI